jgi:hypothetical protein
MGLGRLIVTKSVEVENLTLRSTEIRLVSGQ